MKRFIDYTDAELLTLTDKQTEQLIDLECAFRGIALLIDLSPEPAAPPAPDGVVYKVGGVEFLTLVSAQKAADFLNSLKDRVSYGYEYIGNHSIYTIKPADFPVEVGTEKRWTLPGWEKARTIYRGLASDHDAWEKLSAERKQVVKLRDAVVNEVTSAIKQAVETAAYEKRMKTTFERYMALAENDRSVALAFMNDAYPGVAECLGL